MWSKIEAKRSKYAVRIKLSEEIDDDDLETRQGKRKEKTFLKVKVFLALLIALVTDILIYAAGSPLKYFLDDECNISFHRTCLRSTIWRRADIEWSSLLWKTDISEDVGFMGRVKNDMWHDFDNPTALRIRDILCKILRGVHLSIFVDELDCWQAKTIITALEQAGVTL